MEKLFPGEARPPAPPVATCTFDVLSAWYVPPDLRTVRSLAGFVRLSPAIAGVKVKLAVLLLALTIHARFERTARSCAAAVSVVIASAAVKSAAVSVRPALLLVARSSSTLGTVAVKLTVS